MWVLLMLQQLAHSRNRSTATDEKKTSLFYFGSDFSGWYNFGKIIKTVANRRHILKLKAPNSISVGALGELTVLHQTP